METFESKSLAAAALLVFSIAVISQWAFGFYAANYYNDFAPPKRLSETNKGFLNVDFKCAQTYLRTHVLK